MTTHIKSIVTQSLCLERLLSAPTHNCSNKGEGAQGCGKDQTILEGGGSRDASKEKVCVLPMGRDEGVGPSLRRRDGDQDPDVGDVM